MKRYMVIDGHSLLHRAFYGVRLLTNGEGVYTNALVGFLNILQRLLDEEKPDGLCVCCDVHAPTFRHNAYAAYKAGRRPMPEELSMQMPLFRELLAAMRIPELSLAGYEADDLLGTLSRRIAESGDRCILVSGDRDVMQLIGDDVVLKYIVTKAGRTESVLYDDVQFQLDYGITPAQVIEIKALMGDTSDNIPGVRGVGEKTALELISRFGTLNGVYDNLEDPAIRPAVRDKLRAGRADAEMSRWLATIDRDVPLAVPLSALARCPVDNDRLYRLLDRLSMRQWMMKWKLTRPAEAGDTGTEQEPAAAQTAERILDAAQAAAWLAHAEGQVAAAADADWMWFALADGTRLAALDTAAWTDAERAALWSSLCVVPGGITVYDSKAWYRRALDNGWTRPSVALDVMLAAYVVNDPTDPEKLAARLLRRSLYEETAAHDRPAALASALAALDAPLRSAVREAETEALLYDMEQPLAEVIAHMEYEGFQIDAAALAAFGDELVQKTAALEQSIYAEAGETFNILSPKQLGSILFEKLKIPTGKKTKTGYSTNVDVLRAVAPYYPIAAQVLEYRNLMKLKSTYVDGLLRVVSPDGRIHSTLNQTGTVTGRLSSSEPNLQNIPVRQAPGSRLREMFTAREGALLVDADYSQIELRVLAHVAEDTRMQDAFHAGADIHRITAAQIYGIPADQVSAQQRTHAKAVNFGIVYGISDFSLAEDIGASRAFARELIDKYMETYPGVQRYMAEAVRFAQAHGYTETLDRRRRPLPDIKAPNFNVRAAAERTALNTPIQGTAADIIKHAMVRVFRRLQAEKLQARLILQVHDELIVEAPEAEAETVRALLTEEMERAADLRVRLVAEAGIGRTWAESKE